KIRDHLQLAHSACTFPFCTAAAWTCDADHCKPWTPDGSGGATCTCMLAPLCRRHHRLKTHSDNLRGSQKTEGGGEHAYWTYAPLGGGQYYWKGPRGLAFIRTNRGTYEAAGNGATGAPLHPMAPLTHEERLRTSQDTVKKLLART